VRRFSIITVAMLAIGVLGVHNPLNDRLLLFVWHGSQERAYWVLFGAVSHPTVELSSIAAVLNGDMGRNAPDSAAY
jgi:hypothetical protein